MKKIKVNLLKGKLKMTIHLILTLKKRSYLTGDPLRDNLREFKTELKKMKQILHSKISSTRLSLHIEVAKQVQKIVVDQAH